MKNFSSPSPWTNYRGSVKSCTIGDGVTSIGESAFYGCSILTSVAIPNSVTSIGGFAFRLCSSLTSVAIPNSVTSIGVSAFERCSSLATVTIPNSVTSIWESAFSGCTSLEKIYVQWPRPLAIQSSVFEGVDRNSCVLYVPTGTSAMYMVTPEWKSFTNIEEYDYENDHPTYNTDVNGDGETNILDIAIIADFILSGGK